MKKTIQFQEQKLVFHTNGRSKSTPLVLLHGFCEDASIWDGLLPAWKKRAVIRIDLPGFGGSAAIPNATMDTYCGAVLAVLSALSLDRCVLLGHSLGGYVALAFAQQFPERLQGFGLIHAHPYPDTPEQATNRDRGIETIRLGKKDLYVTQLFPKLFPAPFAAENPEILEQLTKKAKKFPAEGIKSALEIMKNRPDRNDVLQRASCPVLFIVGLEDALIEKSLAAAMTALPKIADIHFLAGIGHMGMLEAPQKTAAIVDNFMEFCR